MKTPEFGYIKGVKVKLLPDSCIVDENYCVGYKASKALKEKLGRDLLPKHETCHMCGNRLCFQPDHLYEGTRKDNVADSIAAGTFNRMNPGKVLRKKRDIKSEQAQLAQKFRYVKLRVAEGKTLFEDRGWIERYIELQKQEITEAESFLNDDRIWRVAKSRKRL